MSAGYGPEAPVPIFQWEREFSVLLAIYRVKAPRRVLEVGTYYGGTLYHWLTNVRPEAIVVSIDSYAAGVDNRSLYADWAPPGVAVHAIEGDSHAPETVAQAAEHGPYDWLFIDAGHSYDEVKADWDAYVPLCAPAATVVFHDILPPSAQHPEIEVETLWREIQRGGYVTQEIVADPEAPWGGLGVIYL